VDDREASERIGRIEGLLEELESLSDPVARDRATETVEALVDLYGEGLARVVALVGEREGLAETLAGDELVSHLLLLHGLHPVPLETRVLGALAEVRPYLESHGGGVELLGTDDGIVRLRMQGSCSGCPSSAMTLKLAIEDAIQKVAPDVDAIEADAGQPAPAAGVATGMPLPQVGVQAEGTPLPQAGGAWATAGALPELASGGTATKEVGGDSILFLRLDDVFYAYRPDCPACEESLAGATLDGSELHCPACARRYDARRAGRCLDAPRLYLEPVPLLTTDAGLVKVAVSAAVA